MRLNMLNIGEIIFKKLKLDNIGEVFRKNIRNKIERKRMKNENFTILANNCIGGVIYHDLNLKFLSPTINLYITPVHFVKFLENLDYYLSLEIKPVKTKLNYPVGQLGDINIYFKHYDSIEEAIKKWNQRKLRINKKNLYILMTDRWCLPIEYLERFNELKYKNKICFTHKEYKNIECCKVVKKWSNKYCVGTITNIANVFGKRLYQYAKDFNYIEWLNK